MNATRATDFFERIVSDGQQAILTPTAYGEVLHASIRLQYEQELRLNRQAITARFGRRITSWTELYKRDPSIARHHEEALELLRQTLGGNNVAIATPAQLGPISSGRPYDEKLVRLVGRDGLDTNDALIFMEASRLGITAIVTMDRDMERARPDFDVYTWV
ncbi:MAG: hypothetical protein H0W06_08810 [Chloroflexia bacterium]|nr:hypothetical protein [Chloroflexia bacterium]